MSYTLTEAQKEVQKNKSILMGKPILDPNGNPFVLVQDVVIVPKVEGSIADDIRDVVISCRRNGHDNIKALAELKKKNDFQSKEYEVYVYGERNGVFLYDNMQSFAIGFRNPFKTMTSKNELEFEADMIRKESEVRGRYLTLATNIERVMLHLISICEEPVPANRKDFRMKIPEGMEKRLRICIASFKKCHLEYYNFYIPQFKMLEKIVRYSKMLTQGYSEYDPGKKDRSYILFHWYDKDPNDNKIMMTEKLMLALFIIEINAYRPHLMQLWNLVETLKQEKIVN